MKTFCSLPGRLFILTLTAALIVGCGRAPSAPRVSAPPGPRTIASSDGKLSLTAPPGWAEDNDLYPGAELQLSNKKEELFAVVLKESKKDLHNITREKYSRITRRALARSLKSSRTTGPAKPTIAGALALQYQIAGKLDGMEVMYLHTAIEGKTDFFQVLAWTQKAKFDAARSTFDQIIQSFHETPAPTTARRP